MDSKLSPALAKRLAAYSATASVALAVAPTAGAQVVYYDINPDGVVDSSKDPGLEVWLDIDVDADGIADLRVWGYYFYPSFWVVNLRRPPGGGTRNGFLACECWQNPLALRLSNGDVIGPQTKPYTSFLPNAVAAVVLDFSGTTYDESHGYFLGREGYAGFQFVGTDGGLRYGWLRLAVDDRAEHTTIYEYAYESTPDTPILAGEKSVAWLRRLLLSPRTFPPSGGTLTYTFTVTNATDEPQPLDLWLDADGPASFRRRLGSGTLAPGEAVTRTVRVQVPAGVPAGVYDVRFKLGDFATDEFINFERYAITKEAGAEAAAGMTDAFAAEPVAGDLFAEAEASEAIVGTHALSVPSPNPSDGRTALTLRVSEPQHVTVAVHDALGRRVAVLHDGPLAPGAEHRLSFDGADLPTGVYVVRAVGEAFADTRVVTLVR